MSEKTEGYKCPSCDGALAFDPVSQKLKCPYCGGKYDISLFSHHKEDTYTQNSSYFTDDNLKVYICSSCGGTIMADDNTAATQCPYCGNPIVLNGSVEGEYKPSKIIPFKLNKEDAKRQFAKHLKGKFLLPKEFKSEAIFDEIKGIYVPFWIFGGKAVASLHFNATKVRHWSDSEYEYKETSYYSIYRAGDIQFADVPVDGSSKMDDTLMQSIEPFDSQDKVDFDTAYLAGYVADKYDIDNKAAMPIANERIKNSTIASLSGTINGYTTVNYEGGYLAVQEGNQDYVFYPVWILTAIYKGKTYTFAMNGQSGKFVGDLPINKQKATFASVAAFFLVTIITLIIEYLVVVY